VFKTIINFIKIQKYLNKIYREEKIEKNLSQIFGVECKHDWVGRLYMVINPIIQNVEDGGNTLIMDRDEKVMIEGWVMKNLELIRNFIINNSMFDLLTYSIEKLDDDENYLVIFKNVYFDDMKTVIKWILFSIGIIGIGLGTYFLVR